jgi:transposase
VVFDRQQDVDTVLDRVAQLEAENAHLRAAALAAQCDRAQLQAKLTESEQTLERVRQAYTHALEQLQLAKRKLFMAKAERHEAVPEHRLPAQNAESDEVQIVKAAAPKEIVRRSLLAASLIAHVLIAKYVLGVPFARQESLCRLTGESLDRGTMCRFAEDVGATLGAVARLTMNRFGTRNLQSIVAFQRLPWGHHAISSRKRQAHSCSWLRCPITKKLHTRCRSL